MKAPLVFVFLFGLCLVAEGGNFYRNYFNPWTYGRFCRYPSRCCPGVSPYAFKCQRQFGMTNFVIRSHRESCLCVTTGCFQRRFCSSCPSNFRPNCPRSYGSMHWYYYHPYQGSSCVCRYQACWRPYWSYWPRK